MVKLNLRIMIPFVDKWQIECHISVNLRQGMMQFFLFVAGKVAMDGSCSMNVNM